MSKDTIDVETVSEPNQTQALARIDSGGLAKAMTLEELHKNLEFVRDVMRKEMREGEDYGQIPGTGQKPTLLQPGAQKLLMTFNLTESVKKEVLREYPNFHREYEFTITVQAANGKTWDGVGTCSTLESKYRYRKAERRCPACGKNAIIQGKAEYGGGWVCFKKKNGCGAKFAENEPKILSQPSGDVENEDPADQWNTVRKMAFKRGLVHATINATNTSELWTQDLEEMAENANSRRSAPEKTHQDAPGRAGTTPARPDGGGKPAGASQPAKPAAQAPTGTSTPAKKPAEQRYATIETLKWLIGELKDCKELAIDYFRKLDKPSVLMPNEGLDSLPLWAVPITRDQLRLLHAAITDFGNGDEAKHAYAPNPRPEPPKEKEPPKAPTKTAPAKPADKKRDPEWWRDIIFLIPPAGVRRDDYLKSPNTIGQLYEGRHDPEVAKRLFGMIAHFEVKKTWTGQDGQERPRRPEQIEAEETFREALDACKDYADKHHRDTGEATGEPKPGPGEDVPGQRAQGEAFQGEERTPFD